MRVQGKDPDIFSFSGSMVLVGALICLAIFYLGYAYNQKAASFAEECKTQGGVVVDQPRFQFVCFSPDAIHMEFQ